MVTERMTWTLACLLGLVLLRAKVLFAQDLPVLVFNGRVVNDLGQPMEGAQVQFWHTDENGIYNHPGFDTRGLALLPDFQYFGTATTANDGTFQFKTYRPGIYSARPIRHIHYKVWWNGSDILTSQFYFADEDTSQPLLLQLNLFEQEDGTLETNKTITVNLGLGGMEPITPSQTEGPFYPVVDFFNFDSDMTVLTPFEQGTATEEPLLASDGPSQSPSHSPQLVNSTTSPTAFTTGNSSPSSSTPSQSPELVDATISPTAVTSGNSSSSIGTPNGSASSTTAGTKNTVLLAGFALLLQLWLLAERLP